MHRTLRILLRRDPSRDRHEQGIRFEGYLPLWPDGRPLAVGMNAFCSQGQRLLGLGRFLEGRRERLLEMLCFPLTGRELPMTKLPGCRVRRFVLERFGRRGRLHFLDGTPTAAVFDLDDDDPAVLHWVGLAAVADGERQWLDLAARPLEGEPSSPSRPSSTFTAGSCPGAASAPASFRNGLRTGERGL